MPPGHVSAETESDAHTDDHKPNDGKAYRTILNKAERQEEYQIEDRQYHREPGIWIHHGKSRKIADPLRRRPLHFYDKSIIDRIQDHIYIKRQQYRLNYTVSDKAFKVVFFCIQAFKKSIAGTEKEYRDEKSSGIYKRA